jgi:hypothetical protein
VQILTLADAGLCFGCFSCGEYGISYSRCRFGLNLKFAEIELIFAMRWMSSMPATVTFARRNLLKPSMGPILAFVER